MNMDHYNFAQSDGQSDQQTAMWTGLQSMFLAFDFVSVLI